MSETKETAWTKQDAERLKATISRIDGLLKRLDVIEKRIEEALS